MGNTSNDCIDCEPLIFADTAEEHLLTLKTTGWPLVRQYRKQNGGNSMFALVNVLTSPPGAWHYPIKSILMADTQSAANLQYKDESDTQWHQGGHAPYPYGDFYYDAGGSLQGEIEYADRELFGTYQTIEDALADMARVLSDPESACCQEPEPCEDKEVIPHVCGHESNYLPVSGCSLCPPVSIKITVPPNKLTYQSGEAIDLTGIVVRAFKANGNLWGGFPHGIIPIDQLDYEPKVAPQMNIWSKNGVHAARIACDTYKTNHSTNAYVHMNPLADYYLYGNQYYAVRSPEGYFFVTQYNNVIYACAPDTFDLNVLWVSSNGGSTFTGSDSLNAGNNYVFQRSAIDNPTYYTIADWIPVSEVDPTTVDFTNPTIGGAEITVSWNYQGNIMTDTFSIEGE